MSDPKGPGLGAPMMLQAFREPLNAPEEAALTSAGKDPRAYNALVIPLQNVQMAGTPDGGIMLILSYALPAGLPLITRARLAHDPGRAIEDKMRAGGLVFPPMARMLMLNADLPPLPDVPEPPAFGWPKDMPAANTTPPADVPATPDIPAPELPPLPNFLGRRDDTGDIQQ